MLKRAVAFISILLIFSCFFSCKKDSGGISSPKTHSITYKINSNNYQVFSSIYYTDTSGVAALSSAVDSTSGWSKSISTRYSQFPVQLQVQGQNSSGTTLIYKLNIYIDGALAAAQQDSAAKFNSFSTQASAIVQ